MLACWECKGGGWDESLRTGGSSAQLSYLVSSHVLSRSRRRPKSANGEDDEDSSLRRVYTVRSVHSILFVYKTI